MKICLRLSLTQMINTTPTIPAQHHRLTKRNVRNLHTVSVDLNVFNESDVEVMAPRNKTSRTSQEGDNSKDGNRTWNVVWHSKATELPSPLLVMNSAQENLKQWDDK